jgi:hypothetical protein
MKKLVLLPTLLSVFLLTAVAASAENSLSVAPPPAAPVSPAAASMEAVANFILGEMNLKLSGLNLATGDKAAVIKNSQEGKQEVSSSLQAAAKNPETGDQLIRCIFTEYYQAMARATSSAQASQVANEQTFRLLLLQTYQNQRIIELLQQLASKSK